MTEKTGVLIMSKPGNRILAERLGKLAAAQPDRKMSTRGQRAVDLGVIAGKRAALGFEFNEPEDLNTEHVAALSRAWQFGLGRQAVKNYEAALRFWAAEIDKPYLGWDLEI